MSGLNLMSFHPKLFLRIHTTQEHFTIPNVELVIKLKIRICLHLHFLK